MTPADLAAALAALGWTQLHLARQLGCAYSLVRRWAAGELAIPPAVAAWLRRRVTSAAADPPPRGWQSRTGKAA